MIPNQQRLLDQAVSGRKEAYSALVRHYQNRIFGFIMRMTADRDAALDLTQDTFIAAWENLSHFRGEASFSTWLFQIAANRTRNYLRSHRKMEPMPPGHDPEDCRAGQERSLEEKQQRRALLAALAELPEKQRRAFSLRFFEELKFHEIARIEGSSVRRSKPISR